MHKSSADQTAVRLLLTVPRLTTSVSVVRHSCTGVLKGFGVSVECIGEIALLLSESCSNVVEHATGVELYDVSFEVAPDACTIVVTDPGPGFDVDEMQTSMPAPSSSTGRGGPLMAALSDELEITAEPGGGTVVRIVKRLDLEPRSLLQPA